VPAIRIGMTAGDGYAEAYYAQEIGLFRKAGIQAVIRRFSLPRWRALASRLHSTLP
jgi:ABC-type nitrate/sulfonate/bicarbonate transport system substrate-binding protein